MAQQFRLAWIFLLSKATGAPTEGIGLVCLPLLRERPGRPGSFAALVEGALSFDFISSKVHSPGGQQGPGGRLLGDHSWGKLCGKCEIRWGVIITGLSSLCHVSWAGELSWGVGGQ